MTTLQLQSTMKRLVIDTDTEFNKQTCMYEYTVMTTFCEK